MGRRKARFRSPFTSVNPILESTVYTALPKTRNAVSSPRVHKAGDRLRYEMDPEVRAMLQLADPNGFSSFEKTRPFPIQTPNSNTVRRTIRNRFENDTVETTPSGADTLTLLRQSAKRKKERGIAKLPYMLTVPVLLSAYHPRLEDDVAMKHLET